MTRHCLLEAASPSLIASIAIVLAANAAHAQSAAISVTANGATSITTTPGTPVHVAFHVTYTGAIQVAYLRGAARVEGDAGVGANFVSNIGSGPLINTGSFSGGSRIGYDAQAGAPIFFGLNPIWANQPVNVLAYDLTIAIPGTYHLAWEPPAGDPGVGLYISSLALYQPPAQTFYEGATITVIPAPATLLVLGGLGCAITRAPRRT